MWLLYNQATAWSTRPSLLLGVDDEWAAYQFDAAVLGLGREVEQRMQDRKQTAEQVISAAEAEGGESSPAAASSRFRGLKGRVTRKIKSVEDWIAGRE